jgi:hypothetical protein
LAIIYSVFSGFPGAFIGAVIGLMINILLLQALKKKKEKVRF